MDVNRGWLTKREYERVRDVIKVLYYPMKKGSTVASTEEYKDTTIEKIQQDITASSYIQAMTDDISKGGMSISVTAPLEIGQHVVIDLYLPRFSKPIKILTEVRNLEKEGGTYKAGLKTVSISKSDLKRIEEHLSEVKKQF
jgi:c-di-GMP-binding flagellar brake protein YcgR